MVLVTLEIFLKIGIPLYLVNYQVWRCEIDYGFSLCVDPHCREHHVGLLGHQFTHQTVPLAVFKRAKLWIIHPVTKECFQCTIYTLVNTSRGLQKFISQVQLPDQFKSEAQFVLEKC